MRVFLDIRYFAGDADLVARPYHDGTVQLQAYTIGDCAEPIATLTTCIDGAARQLGPHNLLVKDWSENAGVAHWFVLADMARDTGLRIATGFTEAHILTVTDTGLLSLMEEARRQEAPKGWDLIEV